MILPLGIYIGFTLLKELASPVRLARQDDFAEGRSEDVTTTMRLPFEHHQSHGMACTTPDPVKKITSNSVNSREDLIELLHDLLIPLQAGQSAGGARIRIGHTGTHFDQVAAELEGYARALWGLAPMLAADPENLKFAGLRAAWVKGLDNGTNPAHEEYWGDYTDKDQRFVEMAAIVRDISFSQHSVLTAGFLIIHRPRRLLETPLG